MNLPNYQSVNGIFYRHDDGKTPAQPNEYEVKVEWLHVPTGSRGIKTVFVVGSSAVVAGWLIAAWNRTPEWWYRITS